MTLIKILPPQKTVVLGSNLYAEGVDMSSMDPDIVFIFFNEDSSEGFVQFKYTSTDYPTRPEEKITSLDPWQAQISEAEEIIFCENNPKTYYSTVAPVGAPIEVTAKGWPQPDNSTDGPPPEKPSANTTLYWDGTEFVWSVFPIDLPLAEAQEYMKGIVNSEAYTLLQPTDWYVVRKSETGVEIPQAWGDWRESIRTSANEKRSAVDSTESLGELQTYSQSETFQTWPSQPN